MITLFTQSTVSRVVTIVFDPHYKIDYVEWMLAEIYEEKKAKSIAFKLRESLNALFEEY